MLGAKAHRLHFPISSVRITSTLSHEVLCRLRCRICTSLVRWTGLVYSVDHVRRYSARIQQDRAAHGKQGGMQLARHPVSACWSKQAV